MGKNTDKFRVKAAVRATKKAIKKQAKTNQKVALGKISAPKTIKQKRAEALTQQSKAQKYSLATRNLISWLQTHPDAKETDKQLYLSRSLSEIFSDWSFVGFYDAKPGDSEKIYLGPYETNSGMFPCGEIRYGAGQCGECA